MSRRHQHHQHHSMQPYDYDRFSDHPRERDQARGIEYQDDSLSSINSDEESYLHHTPHISKDKKGNFFNSKMDQQSTNKTSKPEKSASSDGYHQKDTKVQSHPPNSSDPSSTTERLGRLESMLEELIKRNSVPSSAPAPPPPVKATSEKHDGRFFLEPRRHDFTTSMWINKIQEVSIQNNWNEKSTIQYMSTQMSGIIKAWYNSLPSYNFTWPEWKILISKIFPDNVDFVTTLKRLVTRLKQADESIRTYYFSKMYLIEACKITGADAVSCLIDGLNNQGIQEQAKTQNFMTPETLYSQFLMILPDYTVDYSPTVASTTETVLSNWYYPGPGASIEENSAEVALPQEEMFEYEQDTRNEGFEYHNEDNSGFGVNDGSVASRSIKSPPKRTGTVHSRLDKRFIRPPHFKHHNKIPLAAKVCSICFNRGHLAKKCRNVDKMLYCELTSKKSNSCYFKDCMINDRKLDAFIDTGCTTVTIRAREAHKLDLIINPTSEYIRVYGGGLMQLLGEVDILLEVDSVKAQVRAVVVPDHMQNVSVIVGQAFLNKKNVSVFLQNETLKIFEASTCPYKLTD